MKLEVEIKSKEIKDIRLKALLQILFTAALINNKHAKVLLPYKISPQQYNILRILRGSHPNSIHIQSIKERMLEKTPHTTRMIDKLLLNQYIERERGESDRRKVLVKISEKGLGIMDKIDLVHLDFMKFTHNLNDLEANSLSDLLEKLRENL
jgi:MarR family transcriptional regulator, 2-MHQ and catechol-resistance regulon repressor